MNAIRAFLITAWTMLNTVVAFAPPTAVSLSSLHVRCLKNASLGSTPCNHKNTQLMAIYPTTVSQLANTLLSLEETQMGTSQVEQLSPTTTLVVFIIGVIPFLWATIEFWRRIAFGESFGTGKDSVVIPRPDDVITIGEDGNPESSRGRRTLDKGALTVAYVLFAVAAGSVGIAIASVVMGPRPDM